LIDHSDSGMIFVLWWFAALILVDAFVQNKKMAMAMFMVLVDVVRCILIMIGV